MGLSRNARMGTVRLGCLTFLVLGPDLFPVLLVCALWLTKTSGFQREQAFARKTRVWRAKLEGKTGSPAHPSKGAVPN